MTKEKSELMITSTSHNDQIPGPEHWTNYDKTKEVKAFDETKAGVKGLVDSGMTKVPRFFIHPPQDVPNSPTSELASDSNLLVPIIDLEGFRSSKERREAVVDEIREASETWGFFQIVNHGIPVGVMEEVLGATRRFHEQPQEVRSEWYSRDRNRMVRYFCNGDLLVSKAPADWRDTLFLHFRDGQLDPIYFPEICREAVREYIKHIVGLSKSLSELMSEALGLPSDYLGNMECMETITMTCHYYPACPEPHLTLGATKHKDPAFLTIVLQDYLGGLQVVKQDKWVDINCVKGALVVNIGELMQLITNDKFKSVVHRKLIGGVDANASVACFLYPSQANGSKLYGPIKELLHGNPPLYKETSFTEFMTFFRAKGLDGTSHLSHFRLP